MYSLLFLRYAGRLIVATKFGAVLDMVTDRCTTACLLCYLCSAYPAYTVYFQAIISVDLASHYMHMYRYTLYFRRLQ
jgi:CDP-diacylglycerol--inositol 3-phosphatidyltransferase